MRYWLWRARDWPRRKAPYFWLWMARCVPPRLSYWVCVKCFAQATTGVYSDTVVPDLRAIDVLNRLGGVAMKGKSFAADMKGNRSDSFGGSPKNNKTGKMAAEERGESYSVEKKESPSKQRAEKKAGVERKVMSPSTAAKQARSGKDMGAPGKNFSKIAAKAGSEYGSKEAGQKVAGAILQAKRRAGTL